MGSWIRDNLIRSLEAGECAKPHQHAMPRPSRGTSLGTLHPTQSRRLLSHILTVVPTNLCAVACLNGSANFTPLILIAFPTLIWVSLSSILQSFLLGASLVFHLESDIY